MLIVALTAMLVYDVYVFIKMKVHKTYSTSCILLSSMTLLSFRIAILILIIVLENATETETTLVGNLLGDIPIFLMDLTILCLIY